MLEKCIKWEPIEGLAEKYDIDFIQDGKDVLVIRLYDDKDVTKKIAIRFEHHVDAYRHTNESFYFKICYDLTEKYGREFYGKWTFFKVFRSEYLYWLSEQSCTYADEFNFTHFCIMGTDSIVDILARYEPTVTFVEEKEL